MIDEYAPIPRRIIFWRRLVSLGAFGLFIILFWDEWRAVLVWFIKLINWLVDVFSQQSFNVAGHDLSMSISIWKVFLNVGFYIFVYFISMFMIAQFSLPVQGWHDRLAAFSRLINFWLGKYGLTAFVREGELVAKYGEEESLNPGVVLVDLSSAVVLASQPWEEEKSPSIRDMKSVSHRNEVSPLIRVVGPGVNFIEAGEKIKKVIDLRKQIRATAGVKAITRDGIELETAVFTVFSVGEPVDVMPVAYIGGKDQKHLRALILDDKPEGRTQITHIFELDPQDAEEIHSAVMNGSVGLSSLVANIPELNKTIHPYKFDPQRVFDAFSAGALNNSHLHHLTEWHELTQPICIDLFRGLLSGYTYDRVFSLSGLTENYNSNDGDSMKTTTNDSEFLKTLKAELSFKMRCMGLLSYRLIKINSNNDEQTSGRIDWTNSSFDEINYKEPHSTKYIYKSAPYPLTNSKAIRDHGIKVIAAGFGQIFSQPEIRRQVVETWKARSEREINITLAKYERDAMQVINNARTQVQRDNAYHLSNLFKEQKHSKEALALFLFQSLENIATDPKSHGDLPPKEVLAMLQNLHRWLLIERKDMELKSQKTSGHQGGGDKPENQPKT